MLRICACGDVALAGRVERAFCEHGVGAVVAPEVIDLVSGADLTIANIECPLTDSRTPQWSHFPTLRAAPCAGRILKDLKVGVASLANNHIADYGRQGFDDTIATLEGLGIPWLGVGDGPEAASTAAIVTKGATRIGVLALAQPEISAARPGRWGAAVLEPHDAVARMRALARDTDVAIAYLHFGVEFFTAPTPDQVSLCRALVDAGAKLVLGHHPHVPQGWERYGEGFIAYSLGNFVFDMRRRERFSRIGLVVRAEFEGGDLGHVDVIPVHTDGGVTRAVPAAEQGDLDTHLQSLCELLQDEAELQRAYYYICRDNWFLHLRAFLLLGLRDRNWRKMVNLVHMQGWPQLLQLRKDFARFLVSGRAYRFEAAKSPRSVGVASSVWRALLATVGCGGALCRHRSPGRGVAPRHEAGAAARPARTGTSPASVGREERP